MKTKSIDEIFDLTIGTFLTDIDDAELDRLQHILHKHLNAGNAGKDLHIEELLAAVEYEQIHRD